MPRPVVEERRAMRVQVMIPKDVLAQVDEIAKKRRMSRSAFLTLAAERLIHSMKKSRG